MVKVVVLGSGDVGKKTLIKGILGKSATLQSTAVVVGGLSDTFSSFSWNIDNKYYTATLEVVSGPLTALEVPKVAEALSENCEGVVLVWDVSKKHTFLELESAVAFLSDLSPSVAVCFANRRGDAFDDTEEDMREKVVGWCVENGLEYIFDDAHEYITRPAANARKGLFENEKEGVERLIEALECNMWSNMEPKSQSKDRQPLTSASSESATAASSSSTVEPTREVNSASKIQEAPASCVNCGSTTKLSKCGGCHRVHFCSRDCQKQSWKAHKKVCKEYQEEAAKKKQEEEFERRVMYGDEGYRMMNDEGHLSTGLDDVDTFDRMIDEMKMTRELASSLPDVERRQRAANMVMKLWQMMGGEEAELQEELAMEDEEGEDAVVDTNKGDVSNAHTPSGDEAAPAAEANGVN
eukprot:GILK01006153.1.p1 GENE.GILK01006153.1~~GILK01006153.1.p1  ORF type:complete len:410 (-),score=96.14 GILK01006153.1:62-1291(-)